MKFLLDTNIIIPLEPTSADEWAEESPLVAELLRRAQESSVPLYRHPATEADLRRDKDTVRRTLRLKLLAKYPCLPDAPAITPNVEAELGKSEPGTNDWVDHSLIASLSTDAVDVLVTEDQGIHRKARRLGLAGRVMTVADAITCLSALYDTTPQPPPAVIALKTHRLVEQDPIFDSFREDYPGFATWLTKCKREHRQAWVVAFDADGPYQGICIVKEEQGGGVGVPAFGHAPSGQREKVLKLCSFKVGEGYNGRRLGELLLRTVLEYGHRNRYSTAYVEVFPKRERLIDFLTDFGFEDAGSNTDRGELRLVKPLVFTDAQKDAMDPLAFAIRFGPFAAKFSGMPGFIIPVLPQYHQALFPDAGKQMGLFPGATPFGNAIRKAYLCRTPCRGVLPGSPLFFYRSHDLRCVSVCGVAEETRISSDPDEIARYVGKRTVYRFSEIQQMCEGRDVLAILFRQVKALRSGVKLDDLVSSGVVTAAPQSVWELNKEGIKWLRNQFGV